MPPGARRVYLHTHLFSAAAAVAGSILTACSARSVIRAPASISTAAHARWPSLRASSRGSALLVGKAAAAESAAQPEDPKQIGPGFGVKGVTLHQSVSTIGSNDVPLSNSNM